MTVTSHGKVHTVSTGKRLRALTSDRKLAVLIDRLLAPQEKKTRARLERNA